jgi:hypothetical protein
MLAGIEFKGLEEHAARSHRIRAGHVQTVTAPNQFDHKPSL